MNATLSLALSLCVSCAATATWLDRVPDLHARALAIGAAAVLGGAHQGTSHAGALASRWLLATGDALEATSTIPEEEVQAWESVIDAAPEVTLAAAPAAAWPGVRVAGMLPTSATISARRARGF